MKNLNLRFALFSIFALFAVSIFMTSCGDTTATETPLSNDVLTEEELLAKLQADEDAVAFGQIVEEMDQIVREVLDDDEVSAATLRSLYESQDNAELEKIFGHTNIVELSDKMQYHASKFIEKFPNLEEELSKFESLNPGTNPSEELEMFSNLESNISVRGCGCCGAHYWAKLACKALCVANGTGCAALTAVTGWGPYVCAVAGFSCTEFCDWYYCHYL